MKYYHVILLAVAILMATCSDNGLVKCPIEQDQEVKETPTNDFLLVKACIGLTSDEAAALLAEQDYAATDAQHYTKTEDNIEKEITVYATGNASMSVKSTNLSELKILFTQWMTQYRQSSAYTAMLRESYRLSTGLGEGRQSYGTPEDMLAALKEMENTEDMSANFGGNDKYANQYSIDLAAYLDGIYMQVINQRAGLPSDDFTESDLKEADLGKDILISKVDYLTFGYKGFYALNVTGKEETGADIPIVAQYDSPSDFGSIRLYYRTTDNLLAEGTIVWNGCGQLAFPEAFRAGQPESEGLPYPGQEHIVQLNEAGEATTDYNEQEMRHIWESISQQKEFQHYYANSQKRVAVYLYTPSVGMMNPADAYYLVIVEK